MLIPVLGTLYLLFPLSGTFFPPNLHMSAFFHCSSLSVNVTSTKLHSLITPATVAIATKLTSYMRLSWIIFFIAFFSLSEIISLYVNMHVVYLHHQWFHLPESRNCVTLFTPVPLELGMVLNWWMHYPVDAGPFWNRMQLAAIANYKTIGFHPSLHDSQDHKAEDTQPFLIIPQVPTYSWKWGSLILNVLWVLQRKVIHMWRLLIAGN